MNEVLNTIASRFSCRKYTGAPVEAEKLEKIAMAGLQAPSALNKQPLEVIVIHNKALIEELDAVALAYMKEQAPGAYERILSRGGKVYYNAPSIFLVLKTPDAGATAPVDAGILVQNMALAATSLDLNCVIAAMTEMPFLSDKAADLKARIGWKDGYEFAIGLIVGYGDMEGKPHEVNPVKVNFVA